MSSTADPLRPRSATNILVAPAGSARWRRRKAGVHNVETLIERAREDVCVAVLDVCQAGGRRLVACQLELRVVDIDAEDPTAWPDAPRQVKRDVAATAADIETAHAQIDAQPVEQVAGRRAQGARDEAQPLPAMDPTRSM